MIRKSDGAIEISVAPRARAGNWLPTGGAERYMLVMRFYDFADRGRVANRTGDADAVREGALVHVRQPT